jgi:hypothetical protein
MDNIIEKTLAIAKFRRSKWMNKNIV